GRKKRIFFEPNKHGDDRDEGCNKEPARLRPPCRQNAQIASQQERSERKQRAGTGSEGCQKEQIGKEERPLSPPHGAQEIVDHSGDGSESEKLERCGTHA